MINQSLLSVFADVKQLNEATVTVEVQMTPSILLEKLSKELLGELQRLVPYAGFKDVDDLEVGDIQKYFQTLIWLRCERVRGESKAFLPYKRLYNHLCIPVLMMQLLISIGEAVDRDYAIKFLPVYSISGDSILAPEELEAISDILIRMTQIGCKTVIGLPKEVGGELDFMALCSVEGVVKGYRKAHPVYGFLASFFEQKKLNEITGCMCRVVYGYQSDYETYVTMICRTISHSN